MTEAQEFFYRDKDGKQDADLHEPILTEGDHEQALEVTRRRLKARGWTDEEIAQLIGH